MPKFMCMRCLKELDISERRMDGYSKGLIVCRECYDPPKSHKIRVPNELIRVVRRPSPPPTVDHEVASTITWETWTTDWDNTYLTNTWGNIR